MKKKTGELMTFPEAVQIKGISRVFFLLLPRVARAASESNSSFRFVSRDKGYPCEDEKDV